MGFDKVTKAPTAYSASQKVVKNVSIIKNSEAICLIDKGSVRMRFTSITKDDMKHLASPLYSLLVP